MKHTYETILKNATSVLPQGIHAVDIGIKNGKIETIGSIGNEQANNVIDCTGLHVLPGDIDTQVHFREPGGEHKETLKTGMMAAVMGGVTSIFEMPNTNPLTTTPEALKDKLDRAGKAALTDYAFYFGGTQENAKNLPKWENLPGVCGIKIFMGSSSGKDLKHIKVVSSETPEPVMEALCDDLNTPKALAELNKLATLENTTKRKEALIAAGRILGLLQKDPDEWLGYADENSENDKIIALIEDRSEAKKNKNFTLADDIRDQLLKMNIEIEDKPTGSTWRRIKR